MCAWYNMLVQSNRTHSHAGGGRSRAWVEFTLSERKNMIIHIFKNCKVTRLIEVDEEAALPLFNLIFAIAWIERRSYSLRRRKQRTHCSKRVLLKGVKDMKITYNNISYDLVAFAAFRRETEKLERMGTINYINY